MSLGRFGVVNLSQMRKFYLAWPKTQIFQTLSEKSPALPALASKLSLPWSAYVRLLSVKSGEARSFYEAEAVRSGWSVRQLDRQIESQFYERIALSRNKAAMLKKADRLHSPCLITNNYFLSNSGLYIESLKLAKAQWAGS